MTTPIHPTVFTSDHASDQVSQRLIRGMNAAVIPVQDRVHHSVLSPIRAVFRSGRKLTVDDVKRHVATASNLLLQSGQVADLSSEVRVDRVRKTAHGVVRWFGFLGNDGSRSGIVCIKLSIQRDQLDWLMGDTQIEIRSHALSRYFRRAQRDYDAFRGNAASLIGDAVFLAAVMGHSRPIALATPQGLLCGSTEPARAGVSYGCIAMSAWRDGRSTLRDSVRYSPLLTPPATARITLATFIDTDSLGPTKERVYQSLSRLQEEVRPVALAHLRHVVFAEDFDQAAAQSAIDAVRRFQDGPDWQAYLTRTTKDPEIRA